MGYPSLGIEYLNGMPTDVLPAKQSLRHPKAPQA